MAELGHEKTEEEWPEKYSKSATNRASLDPNFIKSCEVIGF